MAVLRNLTASHLAAYAEWSRDSARPLRTQFSPSQHPEADQLFEAIRTSSFTEVPNLLLMTTGASLSRIETTAGRYYDAVVTDLATTDCEEEIDHVMTSHGLARWRSAIVSMAAADRPHPHFPGSTNIRYLIIHPEAAA
ncbi:hypothetical protein CTZ27_03050 [Streptomyces griseocarneus]|nr:hypothetical protein CTZ27_03050 [Streptomyces griseocarneus]